MILYSCTNNFHVKIKAISSASIPHTEPMVVAERHVSYRVRRNTPAAPLNDMFKLARNRNFKIYKNLRYTGTGWQNLVTEKSVAEGQFGEYSSV